jgi:uncharacterized RDD family membrane protein YckC
MTQSSAPDSPGVRRVACVDCGHDFALSDTIRYQGIFVCRGCQQGYFDRLWATEAVPVPAALPKVASFGTRVAAKLIDTGIMHLVQLPLTVVLLLNTPKPASGAGPQAPFTFSMVGLVVYTLSFAITAAYNIYFVGRHGATPGKMVLRIRVVAVDGTAPTYARAAARYWGEVLSALTCMGGYVVAAFDSETRALHDHVASTRVVRNV